MRARRNNMIHNIPRKQWDTAYFWGRESIQKGRISQEKLSFGLPRIHNIFSTASDQLWKNIIDTR